MCIKKFLFNYGSLHLSHMYWAEVYEVTIKWFFTFYLKICVNMVSIPIQWVIFHAEIIPRKVAWWIPKVVVLIPQNAFAVEPVLQIY